MSKDKDTTTDPGSADKKNHDSGEESQNQHSSDEKSQDVQEREKKSTSAAKDKSGQSDRGTFPIAAIGASAGGFSVIRQLLKNLPDDSGMAFIVILHLSSEHESNLPQLLAKCTAMPVESAADSMRIAPNRVYVIPPDRILTLQDHTLKLSERERGPGKFKPIDRFFKSLAEKLQEKAIAVVLSGTGADGTLGVRAIKAAGGITFAQSEESAEFAEMPRNAIQSGQVDFVLEVTEIAKELGVLTRHPHLQRSTHHTEMPSSAWEQVLQALKTTGIDFSKYKENTVRRRISRRMAINKIEDLERYAAFLKNNPEELRALREDLLIKVTEFFRDPETYEALTDEVFPQILCNKQDDDPIRIWVPGCATGEEAYSLAIALQEFLGEKSSYTTIQIFGTDVSDEAIEVARQSFYTKAQLADLSETRLRKFFTPMEGGYRVKKQLRELCVFARQDFTKDPPFSRMDLVSCRNVLIYFSATLQKKVLPLFHYALNPEGFLLLGSSENIGSCGDLFSAIDKKNRIYIRKKTTQRMRSTYWPSAENIPAPKKDQTQTDVPHRRDSEEKTLQREVDRALLRTLNPTAVVVDSSLDIVQFRGNTTAFFEHPPGKASLNVLKILKDTLRLELRNLIHRAKKEQAPQIKDDLAFHVEQGSCVVSLEVAPFEFDQEGYFLIQFHQKSVAPQSSKTSAFSESGEANSEKAVKEEIQRVKNELAVNQEYTQTLIEEKDEALEDLKAANEEILSSNEELQSLNEELETAKEELESSNEELTTVNTELQERNEQLSRTHNDLSNLILSAQIPFLIVTDDLKIKRISPDAEESLNLTSADVGRTLTDLRLSFTLPNLETTLLDVIHSGQAVEHEIQDHKGRWQMVRLRPYRTERNNGIEGAVLALFDIDRIKRSMEEIEKAHKYALRIVDSVKDPLLVLDDNMRVKTANPAFYEKFQVSPKDTEGQELLKLGAGQWDQPELNRLLKEILPRSTRMDNFQVEFDFPHLGLRTMMLSARKMLAVGSPTEAVLLSITDVTEQKQLEEYLRRAKKEAEEASRAKSEFLANVSHEIRTPMTVIVSALQLLENTELAAEQEKCCTMASQSANSLLALLDDLLDFSKIEADKVAIESQPFDLHENVEDAAKILQTEAARKDLMLQLNLAAEIPRAVYGDRKRLRQVLVNLVGNAIKFTDKGEISIQVDVSTASAPAKGAPYLLFSIRDTGIGIAPKQIEHLFERFTQADSTSTRRHSGVGLGLSICKGLVERMGGAIWVKSEEGEGSTFFFTIPLKEAPKSHKDTARRQEESETGGEIIANATQEQSSDRILLAEDAANIRHLVSVVLRKWGFDVITATTGREALEALRNQAPRLILMDVQMPEMSGLDATRTIREQLKLQIPIIGLTAHARGEDCQRCLTAGMDEVVTKPIDMERLRAVILDYLNR